MVEITVAAQDVERLGARLDAFAGLLEAPERAMLVAALQLTDEAWATRAQPHAQPDGEVAGYAFSDPGGGLLVTAPDGLADPSAILGGIAPRDAASGQTSGKRSHKPMQIVAIGAAGPTTAFT